MFAFKEELRRNAPTHYEMEIPVVRTLARALCIRFKFKNGVARVRNEVLTKSFVCLNGAIRRYVEI
jgi:hypothetical protein